MSTPRPTTGLRGRANTVRELHGSEHSVFPPCSVEWADLLNHFDLKKSADDARDLGLKLR